MVGINLSLSHYDLLGVERDATPRQIKLAYVKQSLALHPDKNPYGAKLMQALNKARDELSDEVKRKLYDLKLLNGSNDDERGSSSSRVSKLKERLAESEVKRNRLKERLTESEFKRNRLQKKIATLQNAMDDIQDRLDIMDRENLQLKHKQNRTDIQVTYLKSENARLEKECQDRERQLNVYINKLERTGRELREERQRSAADAEDRAKQQVSVCYKCNGRATSNHDCSACKGNGALLGHWTKCHNCNGSGTYMSINRQKEDCTLCLSRGAREGHLV